MKNIELSINSFLVCLFIFGGFLEFESKSNDMDLNCCNCNCCNPTVKKKVDCMTNEPCIR